MEDDEECEPCSQATSCKIPPGKFGAAEIQRIAAGPDSEWPIVYCCRADRKADFVYGSTAIEIKDRFSGFNKGAHQPVRVEVPVGAML